MARRIFPWFLTLLFFHCGVGPVIAQQDRESGDFTYYAASSAEEAVITGYIGAGGDVTIPDNIDGLPVRTIHGSGFVRRGTLVTIRIPDSVSQIIGGVFSHCPDLQRIEVGEDNTAYRSIDGVLYTKDLTALIQYPGGKAGAFTIPNGISAIGNAAFAGCRHLAQVTFPSSVTALGISAFDSCTGLKECPLPPGLNILGTGAFQNCPALTSLTLPASLTELGDYAFLGCGGLTGISIPAGITIIGENVFRDCTGLTSAALPPTLTAIDMGAFYNCQALTGVTLPGSLTSIGANAFHGCRGLTTIMIPAKVTKLGHSVFHGCNGLQEIVVAAGNPAYTGIDGVMFNKSGSTLIQFPSGKAGAYTVPAGVTEIGAGAFFLSSGLENVTLPASVVSIGASAFEGSGLKGIILPASVTSLGGSVFSRCPDLLSVSLPDHLAALPESGFSHCAKLSEIHLPDSLTSIGASAFLRCRSLTSINIPTGVTRLHQVFDNCPGLKEFVVASENPAFSSPDGVLFDKAVTTLIQYPGGKAGHYTIPDSVSIIQRSAFAYSPGLTSVSIPGSVTTIPASAFESCTGMTTLSIPAGVTAISEYALYGCTSLREIVVDAGNPAFSSLDGVLFNKNRTWLIQYPIGKPENSYTVPDGVTLLTQFAFARSGLLSLTLPESLKGIDSYAFANCAGLTSLAIPEKVAHLNDRVFSDCTGLTSLTLPDGMERIGNGVFSGCVSLVSIQISGSLSTIGFATFDGCASLTKITLPKNLASIDSGAFNDCRALQKIIFLGDAPRNMGGGFYGVPAGLTVDYYKSSQGFTSPTWWGHPTAALIPPGILSITRHAGTVSITLSGQPGKRYQLQSRRGLGNGSVWTSVATTEPLEGALAALNDPAPPPGQGFYRVAEVDPQALSK